MTNDAQNNYFSQFGLPRHLRIDTAALEKAFYAQSRKLHPDRFASRPLAEQESRPRSQFTTQRRLSYLA